MTYRLPDALMTSDDSTALDHLRTYYGLGSGAAYTGSHFDGWAGGRDPNRFTADDLVAVSFLSVFVPPRAAHRLLGREADRYNDLLAAVGPDRDLADDSAPIEPDWPAWRLQSALRELPGVGRTIASKLCARKRPRLIPVFDSVVGQVTAATREQWVPLQAVLQADGKRLHARLLDLREEAGLGDRVSALRVYDVITWMEGKRKDYRPTVPTEQLAAALSDATDGAPD